MSNINDDIRNWAPLDRMREMLVEGHGPHDVTYSYALFTGILCWTMQRVRTHKDKNGKSKPDYLRKKMRALYDEWEKISIQKYLGEAYFLEISDQLSPHRMRYGDLRVLGNREKPIPAIHALVAIRNGLAHGDDRQVEPEDGSEKLAGYRVYVVQPNDCYIPFSGEIVLTRASFLGIGEKVASDFCKTIDPEYLKKRGARDQYPELAVA